MKSKLLILGLLSLTLSGCKELNDINWPDPVRAQLVKYNIVEPKVDPTITKEVQTVPTPDAPETETPGESQPSAESISLPEVPTQRMDETGPIFERSVTTGEDALEALVKGKSAMEAKEQPTVSAPTAPPNLFGTPVSQNPVKP